MELTRGGIDGNYPRIDAVEGIIVIFLNIIILAFYLLDVYIY